MLSPADSEEIQETLMNAPSESNVAPGEGDSPRWPSLPVCSSACSLVCLCMHVCVQSANDPPARWLTHSLIATLID